MKETKNFFDTNRLNKGYSGVSISKQSDVQVSANRYRHILPDTDIMAEYEEMSPGTMKKILDMAKKEQEHRHSVDLLNIEKHAAAVKMGRLCSLIIVTIISITTIILAFSGYYITSSVFPVAAFAVIWTVSMTHSGKRYNNRFTQKNYNHINNKVHNNKANSFSR